MVKTKNDAPTKTFLSSDIDIEDFNLLNSIIDEQQLGSRRQGLKVVFEGYRRSLKSPNLSSSSDDEKASICEYLSDDKTICGKNKDKPKKTTLSICNACQKAQQALLKQQRTDELRLHGENLRHDLIERMWVLELGVPFQQTGYDTFSRLSFIKDKFEEKDREITKIAPLENDNTFLKQQLCEREEELTKLRAEIMQKDAVIKAYMFQQGTT